MKENGEFEIGDKVKCTTTLYEHVKENENYTIKGIKGCVCGCHNKYLKFEELPDSTYDQEDFEQSFFTLVVVEKVQDNEFVKMMCSNERMIDLPI